ncbi:MAG: hypothetical protein AAGD25_36550 [Cyanobacteria bacterium P01_F01_bin.150]
MLYPYWSPFNTASLPNWIRAGQLCLCSESPNLAKSRVAVDCWLGNQWASNQSWSLVMQIPSLDHADWNRDSDTPSNSLRPVILAVQHPQHGGFYLGRYAYSQDRHWHIFYAGQWVSVAQESVLGWLPIPHRLSQSFSSTVEASRQRLMTQFRESSLTAPISQLSV